MAALGGKDMEDAMRRMLRAVGTGALWMQYSMLGRKGKRNFSAMRISKIMRGKLVIVFACIGICTWIIHSCRVFTYR